METPENPEKSEVSSTLHRSVPIRDSITRIGGGYPDKLVIFKIPASSFWWCRYYTQKKILKRSTKTDDQKKATTFAKRFYEDILLRERNLLPLSSSTTNSFARCARELLVEQEQLIERGERNPKLNMHDKQKLDKDILPFFKDFDVKDITYKNLNEFVGTLTARGLKATSIKVHLNVIHKVFMLALRERVVDRLPPMPKIKMVDSPRGWFSESEYTLLKNTAKELADKKVVVRYHTITREMDLLITFLVNTFLRPSDIKNLRHRNVQIVSGTQKYLRILTDQSKTVNTPVVSMEAAVGIYRDIVALQTEEDRPHGKDDFVFFPHLLNRDFALQTMRRQFDEILSVADLKNSPTGEPRTLYSLRHTAIMFRLTLGGNVDLLTLARNARTSVEMIERFYARPLQAEMNVEKIQSMRQSTNKTTTKKTAAKKSPVTKSAAKKTPTKKTPAKKSSTKKATKKPTPESA